MGPPRTSRPIMKQQEAESESVYVTPSGVRVMRLAQSVPAEAAVSGLIDALDKQRGVLLSSGYDYPGRYTRWDLGFVDPPLVLSASGRSFECQALNARGEILLDVVQEALGAAPAIQSLARDGVRLSGRVRQSAERFPEEQRSRQPSIFSVVRALRDALRCGDEHLGLYGAFGYDLCFQFEPTQLHQQRSPKARDLVLYLPDRLTVVDRQKERSFVYDYEFEYRGRSTRGLPRTGATVPYRGRPAAPVQSDHGPGEYAANVERAREAFRRGDLFELVLSQTFSAPSQTLPSEIFRNLSRSNPAPYALFLNLGEAEYLVGASPEMYVRVEGQRVETCPISGTIPRGRDPVEDAARIRELLSSAKDESELTMCTDVDRNDKSRICEPGSVRVLGRRQIELYSRLIHTVDHVEGTLRPEFDALDAFLSHTWAVTVTGAPKPGAIARIETDEKSPRAWYGGAIGVVGFNGNLNTGLTLRTMRLLDGIAEVRAGATLLYDSEPEAEERETRVKASALLDTLNAPQAIQAPKRRTYSGGKGARVLLIDHHDSFVHTLGNYVRQTGAEVVTLRAGFEVQELDRIDPDVVVLSPGPGTPSEFNLSRSIEECLARRIPVFGVCLGLQGLVEYFGGRLGVLDYPMHGKPSPIHREQSVLFDGIPDVFTAGRYHSLFALPEHFPAALRATARTEDGVIMAIEHVELPILAVQFHPESILSLGGDVGMQMIDNAIAALRSRAKANWPKAGVA